MGFSVEKEEVWRRSKLSLSGGMRMTGSASAVNVVLALFLGENLLEMGGGPGGGVLTIRPGGRDSDFQNSVLVEVKPHATGN